MELQFEKFDLKNLVYDVDGNFLNPRIAIIAKSGSGKSWVIREILYYLYKTKIPCGTVIAPTDKMNKFYDDFIPPSFIHQSYKEEILFKSSTTTKATCFSIVLHNFSLIGSPISICSKCI